MITFWYFYWHSLRWSIDWSLDSFLFSIEKSPFFEFWLNADGKVSKIFCHNRNAIKSASKKEILFNETHHLQPNLLTFKSRNNEQLIIINLNIYALVCSVQHMVVDETLESETHEKFTSFCLKKKRFAAFPWSLIDFPFEKQTFRSVLNFFAFEYTFSVSPNYVQLNNNFRFDSIVTKLINFMLNLIFISILMQTIQSTYRQWALAFVSRFDICKRLWKSIHCKR